MKDSFLKKVLVSYEEYAEDKRGWLLTPERPKRRNKILTAVSAAIQLISVIGCFTFVSGTFGMYETICTAVSLAAMVVLGASVWSSGKKQSLVLYTISAIIALSAEAATLVSEAINISTSPGAVMNIPAGAAGGLFFLMLAVAAISNKLSGSEAHNAMMRLAAGTLIVIQMGFGITGSMMTIPAEEATIKTALFKLLSATLCAMLMYYPWYLGLVSSHYDDAPTQTRSEKKKSRSTTRAKYEAQAQMYRQKKILPGRSAGFSKK